MFTGSSASYNLDSSQYGGVVSDFLNSRITKEGFFQRVVGSAKDPMEVQLKIALALREYLAQTISSSDLSRATSLRAVDFSTGGAPQFASLTAGEVYTLGEAFVGSDFAIVDTINDFATSNHIRTLVNSLSTTAASTDKANAVQSAVDQYFDHYADEINANNSSHVLRLNGHYTTKDHYIIPQGLCGAAAVGVLALAKVGIKLAPVTEAQRRQAHGLTSTDASGFASDKPAKSAAVQLVDAVNGLKTAIASSGLPDAAALQAEVNAQFGRKVTEMLNTNPAAAIDVLIAGNNNVCATLAKEEFSGIQAIKEEASHYSSATAFINAQQAALANFNAKKAKAAAGAGASR